MADEMRYRNPIVSGFGPDPSIALVDGIFYLVTSSFHVFPGLPIYTSRDLQNWLLVGHAINRVDQLSLKDATTLHMPLDTGESMVATAGLFAPTIRYHRGTFYIVCTNARIKTSPDSQMVLDNFIISTTDIESGIWSDPVYFSFNGIDPDIFFDNDDRAYIQGSWQIGDRITQPTTTIKQCEIDVATGKQLSKSREIWGGHARYDTEGPHIYKRGKWYYLLVAEGGTFEHHMLSIARSTSVSGPYESFEGNPILTADGKEEYIQNVGHGELFQDTRRQWWAVVLGVRNEGSWGLGRETFLTQVDWPSGGWPMVAQPSSTFVRKTIQLTGAEEHDNKTAVANLCETDDLEYVYIRTPDLSKYKFYEENGETVAVVLFPSCGGLSSPTGTFTFLGRRQRALYCSATTEVDTQNSPATQGLKAGLALYKDHLRHASINYDFGTSAVSFHLNNAVKDLTREFRYSLSKRPRKLAFKIEASPTRSIFSFRERGDVDDGGSAAAWHELGSCETSEIFAREMTGPLFGIFAKLEDSSKSRREGVTFSRIQVSKQ